MSTGHAIIDWCWEYREGDWFSFAPDDLKLNVSWTWCDLLGGYSWQIDAIGQKDPTSRYGIHWLNKDHPVIDAIVSDLEQSDQGLDHHIQYLARERQLEVA